MDHRDRLARLGARRSSRLRPGLGPRTGSCDLAFASCSGTRGTRRRSAIGSWRNASRSARRAPSCASVSRIAVARRAAHRCPRPQAPPVGSGERRLDPLAARARWMPASAVQPAGERARPGRGLSVLGSDRRPRLSGAPAQPPSLHPGGSRARPRSRTRRAIDDTANAPSLVYDHRSSTRSPGKT